jgi:quinohemoprotein ethanol dehydrogenase
MAAAEEPESWLTYGGTYDEQRHSALGQINRDTLPELGVGWVYETAKPRGAEATPIVVDGVMYVSSAWSVVYALDAKTGDELWVYDPQVSGKDAAKGCCDVVNRGVAVHNGKVFIGVFDGRLEALDAATGEVLWSEVTVDQSKPYTITGAPRVFKNKVIIGNAGGELGVRGYVTAYDVVGTTKPRHGIDGITPRHSRSRSRICRWERMALIDASSCRPPRTAFSMCLTRQTVS